MYVEPDFATKKELKEAVAQGKQLRPYQPAGIGPEVKNGKVCIEGPHYPRPHRWYADCTVENGIIIKVK